MANEYLRRIPTSTGNRRVFTWSGWVKLNNNPGATLFSASPTKDNNTLLRVLSGGQVEVFDRQGSDPTTEQVRFNPILRDYSSWTHILINADTTQATASSRVRAFINGVELSRDAAFTLLNNSAATDTPPKNQEFWRLNGAGYEHYIGALLDNSLLTNDKTQYTDVFFVDGQALTPDVFGKYIKGNGYISAGSTQSTDFRKGQWVPKAPRVIKSVINARGGFGINGFYLPMNDSNNFGADFHCDPNSIIKLNEELAQPKVGVSTATVGLGYTDVLRADPYAANLVLALPFVSSGLCTNGTNVGVNTGFGDYSHIIRGSGSAKVGSALTIPSIGSTASYYGSAAFFNGSTQYLTFPTNTDFDFGTGDFTIEYWANYQTLSPALSDTIMGGTSTGCFGVYMSTSQWGFVSQNQAALQLSSGTIVGTNQWNHFAVVRKGNTLTGYLNGVAGDTSTTWTYNMTNTGLGIGAQTNGNNKITGYIQDLRIYKGVAKYTGGFDVPRPYTPVGIATWRAVPDTTSNNFATLNALYRGEYNARTLTNGNLTISHSSDDAMIATVGITTGKWYWETLPSTISGTNNYYGIVGAGATSLRTLSYFYRSGSGTIIRRIDNVTTTLQSSLTNASANDVIGIAFNASDKELSWYLNGTQLGTTVTSIASTSIGTSEYFPFVANENSALTKVNNLNFGQNPTFSGNTTAGTFTDSNGKGLFKYQPPSGFLALCEDNLPTPAISDPGKHFKTVLYTGDGNNGRSIVGVGFTPDLVWIKDRNNGAYNHLVSDSVRGAGFALRPSATTEETASGIRAFSADGFSISSDLGYNVSGNNHVAWCWRAGAGTTSTNTNGSITSVVSVNQDAGFSIVSYTGNATSGATVGHGLGKTPAFIFIKRRDSAAADWPVWHKSLTPTTGTLWLNLTSSQTTYQNRFDSSGMTSSVFKIGTTYSELNISGATHIAYCWVEIEGFSKFGSYVGNASTDGPFVYCGFKPAWIMIKRTDAVANWEIRDSSRSSTNPTGYRLYPNLSSIEDTDTGIDFLSNGFKIRDVGSAFNASGGTYIFAAFAESPFKTANAK